jgi:hypothetical protein
MSARLTILWIHQGTSMSARLKPLSYGFTKVHQRVLD